ncbi:PQ-loop-domain-containing protein [Amylocystis lapponica]|nr:PQ-loop-domain-containing protein [Amylocystis lapponica]
MNLSGNETLSSVLGWVSIACWLVVYTPQIIENYQLKSGEGLSVFFVAIWLIGDVCSLAGSLLAGLLPTIIILSAYYLTCDSILLIQIYYYRWVNSAQSVTPLLVPDESEPPDLPEEETPLLLGSAEANEERAKSFVMYKFGKYAGALLFVFVVGLAAWTVDEHIHRDKTRSQPSEEVMEWRSQMLGWISAVMFCKSMCNKKMLDAHVKGEVGARVPQIVKNFKTKCEGLSPFLFVYSITGNTTYVLAILTASMDLKHLIANAPWIAGSALTVFLDIFVLCQFFYYQSVDNRARGP